uniref:DUF8039 domain-containing protein n=1 Tax=Setaria viridis TaxID=4556 RepID=A0A4U6VQL4_SETVI|nr:LOW QUALITY PROTEIN: hypothetical protein SEVIR_2G149500v2 [Setaria viridis]
MEEEVASTRTYNLQGKGLFKPSRERDELTLALGNPEHIGRVRGPGKRVIWKEAWEEDSDMYKKHDRDREAILSSKQSNMIEVAMGEAHPPSGLYHTRPIPPDYTRVETVKPEYSQWRIDYPTPEGLSLLGEVVNQFVLWHKRDIILTTRTPSMQTSLLLEGVYEEREIQTPPYDHHMPEMPQSSPPPLPTPLLVEPTHEQQESL